MVEEEKLEIIDEVLVTLDNGNIQINKDIAENMLLRIKSRYREMNYPLKVYILNTDIANTMLDRQNSSDFVQLYPNYLQLISDWEAKKHSGEL